MGKICDRRGRTIARVESLGAENLEAQEHYSRYSNSTFSFIAMGAENLEAQKHCSRYSNSTFSFIAMVPSVSKYLLNGTPSHMLKVIRILTFFLAGISKNKHNYCLPRFCVFLYQV